VPFCDILHSLNAMASKQIKVQQDLFIVPASTSSLAFPLLEGRGELSTGLEIPDSPSVSLR
jgi:hypothetical protein